ncbi:molybdopterin-binding protein [Methylobacterium planeticum]|uniref:Molybdopterin molybdenumtransferase n=1 Tax=Methylobacterium planeticum TaxID=2615211 RepID=A0A6N6MM10_9HYPH|nr:molybdopterin-binding protein [Methylobacterium planeticum]KAB1070833.1 molybdopterin-binding protein [Methylobacterium planeticum]
MARASSAALMPLDEALARLRDGLAPVTPCILPLAEAVGRIAAATVTAAGPLPRGRSSLRDGWAAVAAEITGASPYAPVPLPRAPAWIEAGEALPPGHDTVLPAEAIAAAGPGAEAVSDAPAGDGTRPAGGDLAAGQELIGAGARVTALRALALAEAGLDTVAVRVPRVALVLTGAGRRAGPEARGAALAALVGRAGGRVASVADAAGGVADWADALAAAEADAILVVGGTGFGRADHAADALAAAGRLDGHGLALRPGETAGFGRIGATPVLLLPGRPEAMLAAFLALARPLLAVLAGARPEPARRATLRRKVTSGIGLSEIVFVAGTEEGAPLDAATPDVLTPDVLPLGGAELALGRLLLARGAILVPPEREGYSEGTPVAILPL